MTYNFLMLRRCLDGETKFMFVKDFSMALRVFTDWTQLKSKWVEIVELTDEDGSTRRMFLEDTP